jgi:aminoglycoside phosphotransferase family enzyme/predicted kinase
MPDLAHLIEALSHPAAFPYAVDVVQVRQTHISVVFIAGPHVYKLKKPVNLGFVDFSSLDKRRFFCDEEVRLNRRLAPEIYLGVVPAVQTTSGPRFEGEGEVLDWAVKMRYLPEEANLHKRLQRADVQVELVEELARRIASFHRVAETSERIAGFGRFESVSRLVLDIFDQAMSQVGTTVDQRVFERVKLLTEQRLGNLRPIIDSRAQRSVPRDCHGDLHLDHIYYFPDVRSPADLVIIDCIEFNERFRFIDPVADMAFAAMDLAFHGRRDLARTFAETYFQMTGDSEGCMLLPLYSAYRATVRGLVDGLKYAEMEVPVGERNIALERSRAHWLLALSELEDPAHKPCLLLVAGLPGTGKSRVAQDLALQTGFTVIRSDVVRKELAGVPVEAQAPTELREALYSSDWNEQTYAECLHRAEKLLFAGKRVLVDATFWEEAKRQMFGRAAVKWGVSFAMLVCEADSSTVRSRLANRTADASDADWSIYERVAAKWECVRSMEGQAVLSILTECTAEEAARRALEALQRAGLTGG